MKAAIASVDIYVFEQEQSPRRLSLTIGAPERSPTGDGWQCRVVLANLHRPRTVAGMDSVEALAGATDIAREWLAELRARGFPITRDRAGKTPFEFV